MEGNQDRIAAGFEYRFECARCSACCRGEPGVVFLTARDLAGLASFFNVSEEEFLATRCRVIEAGTSLYSLREKPGYDCVLWDGLCTAYDSRPVQCRTYPFWERIVADEASWRDEARYCPGIGKGKAWTRSEIDAAMAARSGEALIGPDDRPPGVD